MRGTVNSDAGNPSDLRSYLLFIIGLLIISLANVCKTGERSLWTGKAYITSTDHASPFLMALSTKHKPVDSIHDDRPVKGHNSQGHWHPLSQPRHGYLPHLRSVVQSATYPVAINSCSFGRSSRSPFCTTPLVSGPWDLWWFHITGSGDLIDSVDASDPLTTLVVENFAATGDRTISWRLI